MLAYEQQLNRDVRWAFMGVRSVHSSGFSQKAAVFWCRG